MESKCMSDNWLSRPEGANYKVVVGGPKNQPNSLQILIKLRNHMTRFFCKCEGGARGKD